MEESAIRSDEIDNMKPTVDFKIIPATINDKESFFRFMQRHFYPEEPINSSINRLPESLEELTVLNGLSNGFSFKAVDQSENILGIVLNTLREPSINDHQERLKNSRDPGTYSKLLNALEVLEHGSDFWNRTKVDKAFDTVCLATNTEYRGLNIGKKLLERSLDLAKSLNFEFATIECSSLYSAKIAADLDYESYYELVYKDYRDADNKIIFNVKPPHTGMKFYVKKLH